MGTVSYRVTRLDAIPEEQKVRFSDLLLPHIYVVCEYISATSLEIVSQRSQYFTPPTTIPCQSFFGQQGEHYLHTHLSTFPHLTDQLINHLLPRLIHMVQIEFAIKDDDINTSRIMTDHSNDEPHVDVAHRCFGLNIELLFYLDDEGNVLGGTTPNFDGMVPASEEAVQMMLGQPKAVVEREQHCAICMEGFDDDVDAVDQCFLACAMPCHHVFHRHCILLWLRKNHVCPLCRYAMPTSYRKDFSLPWYDATLGQDVL